MLRQPIDEALEGGRVFLLAGAGGGYDVLGALPLYETLTAAGREVHLANLTFTSPERLPGVQIDPANPRLFRLRGGSASRAEYCPEAWLAAWLEAERGDTRGVWCLEKTGVQPLRRCYGLLVESLGIDSVVLVDGGVDSLLRGDEASLGTPAEDLVSLAAVAGLELANPPILASIGFGSELRDGVCHAQALEAIARLTGQGHLLGVSAVLARTAAGSLYERALSHVLSHQSVVRGSHVQGVIRAALQGDFGETRAATWVSPLAALYWFFDLRGVARSHLFLSRLAETRSIWEATAMIEGLRKSVEVRPAVPIPL